MLQASIEMMSIQMQEELRSKALCPDGTPSATYINRKGWSTRLYSNGVTCKHIECFLRALQELGVTELLVSRYEYSQTNFTTQKIDIKPNVIEQYIFDYDHNNHVFFTKNLEFIFFVYECGDYVVAAGSNLFVENVHPYSLEGSRSLFFDGYFTELTEDGGTSLASEVWNKYN